MAKTANGGSGSPDAKHGPSGPNGPSSAAGPKAQANANAKELVEARRRLAKGSEEAKKLRAVVQKELGLEPNQPLPDKVRLIPKFTLDAAPNFCSPYTSQKNSNED